MGRWLKKMANKVKDMRGGGDDDEDDDEEINIDELEFDEGIDYDIDAEDGDDGDDDDGQEGGGRKRRRLRHIVKSIVHKVTDCHQVARETVELCQTTRETSDRVVDFGSEIKTTLERSFDNMDASVLETIKDLTNGDRVKEAMELAKDMNVVAVKCIDKSVQMIDLIEGAVDDLPDPFERMIMKAAREEGQHAEEASRDLSTLDDDINDVKACITAIAELNITTAFKVGLHAFEQLSRKAQRSRAMFESIRGFSTDVGALTDDLKSMDVISVAKNIKGLLRCINLCDVMRKFAEGAKMIIQMIVELFKATADRISTLWEALAYAKDCMVDCLEKVVEAKTLCFDAREKSVSLITRTLSVKDQMESVGELNSRSLGTIRELSRGDEIREAIELARNMDDLVLECADKVTSMVDRVSEGFRNLPDIITDGFDMIEDGKQDDDPEPIDLEEDIAELETSRDCVEKADIFKACKAGYHGIALVSGKGGVCRDLLELVEGFATNCNLTIDSFMNVWDLNTAVDKIKEMCRLVSLGELMKQFASQIKRLIMAMIDLMKLTMKKLSSLDIRDLGDFGRKAQDAVEDLIGNMDNLDVGKAFGGLKKFF